MGFSPVGGEAKAAGRLGGLRARGPRGMEARSSSSSCACESTQEGGGHGSGGGGMPRRQGGQEEAEGRREQADPGLGTADLASEGPATRCPATVAWVTHATGQRPCVRERETGSGRERRKQDGAARAHRRRARRRRGRSGGEFAGDGQGRSGKAGQELLAPSIQIGTEEGAARARAGAGVGPRWASGGPRSGLAGLRRRWEARGRGGNVATPGWSGRRCWRRLANGGAPSGGGGEARKWRRGGGRRLANDWGA